MTRALIIGAAERDRIAALRERAAAAPFSLDELAKMSDGYDPKDPRSRPKPGQEMVPPEFSIEIPVGFLVTYTLEHQPIGLCRHISISVEAENAGPNPYQFFDLLGEFGFAFTQGVALNDGPQALREAGEAQRLFVFIEHLDDTRIAINVVEPIR